MARKCSFNLKAAILISLISIAIDLSAVVGPCQASENCARRFARMIVPGVAGKLPLLSKKDTQLLLSRIASKKSDSFDYSFFQGLGEEILVAADKDIDPALYDWLMKASKSFNSSDEDLTKVEKLARFTRTTLNRSYEPNKHPVSNLIFKNLNRKSDLDEMMPWGPARINRTLIGDYIRSRSGECRHLATTLAIALRKAGIKADVVAGTLSASKQGIRTGDRGLHAWVEFEIPNRGYFLVDPSNSIFKPVSVDLTKRTASVPVVFGKEKTPGTMTFEPTHGIRLQTLSRNKAIEFGQPESE